MGGAVSSGRDNDELIDNLMGGNYIRSRCVEKVFRALDRADYMTPDSRDQAYKDLAWQNGPLHMSAPCIYSEVMEGLELKPGLSFLNVGSGTGYLSTLVGLILGSSGINHGVEVHPIVIEYANKKISQFMENSIVLDEFDFCVPKFYYGNGLCIAPLLSPYDRVYCGAGCPEEYKNYFKQLIKVGGILVMPLNDNLVQVKRVSQTEWASRSLLNVSFATLRVPTKEESAELIKLEEQTPVRLQALARSVVRSAMRAGLLRRHPELREPPPRQPPAKKSCPRRICIPIEGDSDVEGFNALHDLDRAGGAHEMNALLSLVLSMGQNRVAGALRFDRLDSHSGSSDDDVEDDHGPRPEDDDDDDNDDDDGGGDVAISGRPPPSSSDRHSDHNSSSDDSARPNTRSRRGLLTFEFRDMVDAEKLAANSSAASSTRSDNTENVRPTTKSDPPSKEDTDNTEDPAMPAEVEIYLGKSRDAGAGTSACDMDWEESTGVEAEDECSSDEETAGESVKSRKAQKLDSGIGEETTPSSDSSPVKSDVKTDESDVEGSRRSDSFTDDMNDARSGNRRRLPKRGRWSGGARSSTSTEEEGGGEGGGGGGGGSEGGRRRCKRRAADAPSADARRVRLSLCMKRGVKELPLPYALKKYVNLGRCFEF